MRPVDNPKITLASADCWRFTVRSDLQNKTYYIYAESYMGGLNYICEKTNRDGELLIDYLGNVGIDRIVYTRPPLGEPIQWGEN
jgi:hypothetical protein